MNVKILYRNYKPLHKIYESLVANPPEGVSYIVPPVKSGLARFMVIYRKYRHLHAVKWVTKQANRFIFSGQQTDGVDIYHAVNMIPADPDPVVPYILEAEHAAALTNFADEPALRKRAAEFIMSDYCRAVICTTKACQKTFKWLLGERNYKKVQAKFHVVYPSIRPPKSTNASHEIMNQSKKLQLLFVGNDCYRKGLHELLEAMKSLPKEIKNKVHLYIVSSDADELVKEYSLENVSLYPARFSKEDILKKFFIPADAFVLPTRLDTFGMVVVDAMAAGTPVLATAQFALPELIADKKDGVLIAYPQAMLDKRLYRSKQDRAVVNSKQIDQKLTKEISETLNFAVENKTKLKAMGKAARDKYVTGNFAIAKRNQQIKKIYEDVLS